MKSILTVSVLSLTATGCVGSMCRVLCEPPMLGRPMCGTVYNGGEVLRGGDHWPLALADFIPSLAVDAVFLVPDVVVYVVEEDTSCGFSPVGM